MSIKENKKTAERFAHLPDHPMEPFLRIIGVTKGAMKRPQKPGDRCPWGLAFHVVFPESPRPRRKVKAKIYSEEDGSLIEKLPVINYPQGKCIPHTELYDERYLIDREFNDVYDVHKLPEGRYRAEAKLLNGEGEVCDQDSLKFEVGPLPELKHKIKLDWDPSKLNPGEQYFLTGTIKVGDVDGDGEVEYIHIVGGRHIAVYRGNGDILWKYTDQEAAAWNKDISLVWDLNNDGKAEILTTKGFIDDVRLCLLDGNTGEVIKDIAFPALGSQKGPFQNSFLSEKKLKWYQESPAMEMNAKKGEKLGIPFINGFTRPANFRGLDKARDIMLQVGSQNFVSVVALTDELEVLWQYDCVNGRAGHVPMVHDTDNDGKDELILGTELIDDNGEKLWEKPFEEFQAPWEDDHIDVIDADDINGDGKAEIVYSSRMVVDAESGERLWLDATWHGQDIFIGKIRDDIPGKQIVFNDREYRHSGHMMHGSLMDVRDNDGNRLFSRRFMSMHSTQMLNWLPDKFRQICIGSDLQRSAPKPNLQIFDGHGFLIDVLPGYCPHNLTRDRKSGVRNLVPQGLMISKSLVDGYIDVFKCRKTK